MSDTIDTLLQEARTFPPRSEFAARANVNDSKVYDKAAKDRLGFWEGWAKQLDWFQPWNEVLDWTNAPFAKWFVG
ncbi:MAG: acetyl-CoA synthetase, partial [Fimbriimonadaceae bacterium]|nr:acetyl-CoA synthetase [Fimbriimonadaceae bacterium]